MCYVIIYHMKDKLLAFFKDKFNIALVVIQILALISFCFSEMSEVFASMFFVLEGAFFIVLGIKILQNIKKSRDKYEMISQLPYTNAEKAEIIKKIESANKNNKFIGVVLILIGIVLIFSLFSLIF